MIYLEPRVLGWRPLVESWINGEIAEPLKMYKNEILALFDFLVPQVLGKNLIFIKMEQFILVDIFNRSCSTCDERIESNW